ncbi:thymidine phosphorylase family protein [Amphritea balenae]|uniref:Putative thymidine phosphorylase n=1 Tax=Amphritea balenae TaxID=452629 RepID=A0A3P1SLT9_9GAMM|nr:thymidine phosphorylase family protein [Amphritea balenae]RRC98221.1 thymidine phosphorylase family protein [Amphritea balenae]GGK80222.1 putative thymidine phosphorylase [Amphritea balenae]
MIFTPDRVTPLQARRLGIDTRQEPIIYLRADSPVCRSEGFSALSRVLVRTEQCQIIATLNIITGEMLRRGQIGFSESAWHRLKLNTNDSVWLSHPRPVQSLSHVRAKVYGHQLNKPQFQEIINDIVDGHYADVHLAAFITACGDDKLNDTEITALTQAMIDSGSRIDWGQPLVIDKHCVGGLPGNRTTPIVVAILAASGLTMPKTSSRAITSPAGTADTMETMTEVSLSLEQMKQVVQQEGACLAWGGSVRLSPSDDILIQVERALDIDSEGQLIASVLSKKIAAGATHVLIDIPVGPTAKVRSKEAADKLAASFNSVAAKLNLNIQILYTDGSQPVGNGIGPALEAKDVMAVLQNDTDAPQDLKQRALSMAGAMLEMSGTVEPDTGLEKATTLLENGLAWEKFCAICTAQGGIKQPDEAPYLFKLIADKSGKVDQVDNRRLAQVAKLAGAPMDPTAGIEIHVKLGQQVQPHDPLLTIHAESSGELNYAVDYLENHPEIIRLKSKETEQ